MTTPSPYLLDTNVYAILFQNEKTNSYANLLNKIKSGSEITFFIPEIVSMEIHSVLGKYRRRSVKAAQQPCTRNVIVDNKSQQCAHICLFPAGNRINAKVFKAFQKLLSDIEAGRGLMKAQILPVGADEIAFGKMLLTNYADRYAFGSHDALVAGTLLAANKRGVDLTLITSDKGLKAVCREMQIKIYDPNLGELIGVSI